jgi:DNA-directed RNA polymerase specialized sigma subunit
MSDIDRQNEALVKRLLSDDSAARDELIELNFKLVQITTTRVLHSWPNFQHLRCDLEGVGAIALVQAVDRLRVVGVDQPIRNYLITAIRSKILRELAKQAEHAQHHQYVDSYQKVPKHTLAVDDPTYAQIEDREFLLSLCDSPREREIVARFLDGEKAVEIIAAGHSYNVVHKTLRLFREKVQNSRELVSG